MTQCVTKGNLKKFLDEKYRFGATAGEALNSHLCDFLCALASRTTEALGTKKTVTLDLLDQVTDVDLREGGNNAVKTYSSTEVTTGSKAEKAGIFVGTAPVVKCFKGSEAFKEKKYSFSKNVDVYLAGVVQEYLKSRVFPPSVANLEKSKKKTLLAEHVPEFSED